MQQQMADLAQMRQQNQQMQQQMAQMQADLQNAAQMHEQVSQAFDQGLLRQSEDVTIIVVDDPAERQSLASQRGVQSRRRPIGEADIDRINAELAADEEAKR